MSDVIIPSSINITVVLSMLEHIYIYSSTSAAKPRIKLRPLPLPNSHAPAVSSQNPLGNVIDAECILSRDVTCEFVSCAQTSVDPD